LEGGDEVQHGFGQIPPAGFSGVDKDPARHPEVGTQSPPMLGLRPEEVEVDPAGHDRHVAPNKSRDFVAAPLG
jgi:hypothetical protein